MKYSIGILTTVLLVTALVLSSCDNKSDKVDRAESNVAEAERDLEIAKSEVEAELRMYRANNTERIKEYNRKISDIEQRVENESDEEVREELEEKLDELKESHTELKREMDNYQASGRENWEEFKDSFTSKMDDLGDSLENFFSTPRATLPTN